MPNGERLGEGFLNLSRFGFVSRCFYSQSAAVISGSLAHFAAPLPMGDIPVHGLCQALFHIVARAPAKLGTDAAWVNRVAAIVARTVGHRRDQVGVGS